MGFFLHTETYGRSTLHFKCDFDGLVEERMKELKAPGNYSAPHFERSKHEDAVVYAIQKCQDNALEAIRTYITQQSAAAYVDSHGL